MNEKKVLIALEERGATKAAKNSVFVHIHPTTRVHLVMKSSIQNMYTTPRTALVCCINMKIILISNNKATLVRINPHKQHLNLS